MAKTVYPEGLGGVIVVLWAITTCAYSMSEEDCNVTYPPGEPFCLENYRRAGSLCYMNNGFIQSVSINSMPIPEAATLVEFPTSTVWMNFYDWYRECGGAPSVFFIGVTWTGLAWQWPSTPSSQWFPWIDPATPAVPTPCPEMTERQMGFSFISSTDPPTFSCEDAGGSRQVLLQHDLLINLTVTFSAWPSTSSISSLDLAPFQNEDTSACVSISMAPGQSYFLRGIQGEPEEPFTILKLRLDVRNLYVDGTSCVVPLLVVTQPVSQGRLGEGDCQPFCGNIVRCRPQAGTTDEQQDVTVVCDCSDRGDCQDVVLQITHDALIDKSIPAELCAATVVF